MPAKAQSGSSGKKSSVHATSKQNTSKNAAGSKKIDHGKVEAMFAQYEKSKCSEQKFADRICKEVIVHALPEDETFDPCSKNNIEHEIPNETQLEHGGAKIIIENLFNGSRADEFFGAKVTVLSGYLKNHVGEEEKGRNGIFATAQKAGVGMTAFGQSIQARKQEVMQRIEKPP